MNVLHINQSDIGGGAAIAAPRLHQSLFTQGIHSLTQLLKDTGFTQIIQRTATESYIPNWPSFNLDTEPDGSIYKPDSLYMEAIKPQPLPLPQSQPS